MDQNQVLFNELKACLKQHKNLRWDEGNSESSGEKIEAVRLPWWKIFNWKREEGWRVGNKKVTAAADMGNWSAGWRRLEKLINDPLLSSTVTIKRNVNKDAKVDLYILIPFGWWWYVGIKTTVVNS